MLAKQLKTTKKKDWFLSIFLGTLHFSLLGSLWTGKGVKWSKILQQRVMGAGEDTIRADQDF